jgi:hypothetical protein
MCTQGASASAGHDYRGDERQNAAVADAMTAAARLARNRRHYLVLVLLCFLVVAAIVSRRPDAVLRAQFWAEDGVVWFAQNYNLGVPTALSMTQAGYFHTFPRLAAALALLPPLSQAPLVMNLLAIAAQALPACFLLTRRFEHLASSSSRLLMVVLLLAIPTSFEVHANVTNSMWFLALTAFLVLIAAPPANTAWRVFDVAMLALSGTTGPFCLLLLPIAVIQFLVRRQSWTRVLLGILCVAVVFQSAALFTGWAHRTPAPLGATPRLFVAIVAGRIIVSPVLGLEFLLRHPAIAGPVCALAFVGAGLLAIYAILKAPLELRLVILFGSLVAGASLLSPLVAAPNEPSWPPLADPRVAGRYWLIPVASFLWICVWTLGRERPLVVRAIGSLLIASALWTGISYWRYAPFENLHFSSYAAEFQRVRAGQDFTFPINPRGWNMVLRKR